MVSLNSWYSQKDIQRLKHLISQCILRNVHNFSVFIKKSFQTSQRFEVNLKKIEENVMLQSYLNFTFSYSTFDFLTNNRSRLFL